MQNVSFVAQPHVRPILIAWSRKLALMVSLLASAVIVVGGFLTLASWITRSFFLVLVLLLGFTALGLALWLPSLLPTAPASTPLTSKK